MSSETAFTNGKTPAEKSEPQNIAQIARELVPGVTSPVPTLLTPEAIAKYRLYVVRPGLIAPARDWLIDGLFPERGIVFFGGHPKAGKTWLALDAAISIAIGENFLGRPVRRLGTVLYLLGEDDLGDTLGRIDALLKGRGLDRAVLQDRLVLCDHQISLENGMDKLWIDHHAKQAKPALIVFDPLARFLSKAEENSATEMRPITNWLRQLQRETSATLLIVHHTDKDAKGLRGTGDLRALSEATLLMGKKGDRAPISLEVRRGRCPDPFDIELVDAPNGGVRWDLRAHDEDLLGRLEEVKGYLRAAGGTGTSITSVARKLAVRWDTAKDLLELAGAINLNRGHWFLPEHVSPVTEPRGPIEQVSVSSSAQASSWEGFGRVDGNDKVPDGLESSHDLEGSQDGISSSFPPRRGLKTPRGENTGTKSTPGVHC